MVVLSLVTGLVKEKQRKREADVPSVGAPERVAPISLSAAWTSVGRKVRATPWRTRKCPFAAGRGAERRAGEIFMVVDSRRGW